MTAKLNINKLLASVDLFNLVEKAGTTLTHKTGRGEARGKCPIHGGNNPTAFQIYTGNDGRQRWRCWSECNTGGDAVSFVMAMENLDFIEAVKWLADYANLSLDDLGFTQEAAKVYAERRQRSDILDLAAGYFADQLWSEAGKAALVYARSRGFTDDVLRMAGWGFSDGSTGLRDHLEQTGADWHSL